MNYLSFEGGTTIVFFKYGFNALFITKEVLVEESIFLKKKKNLVKRATVFLKTNCEFANLHLLHDISKASSSQLTIYELLRTFLNQPPRENLGSFENDSVLKYNRIYHIQICHFGLLNTLSYRQLRKSRKKKSSLPCLLPICVKAGHNL